jgi:hypothetical protein
MIHLTHKPIPYKPSVTWDLAKNQQMILMPLGDIHYGSRDFPLQHLIDNIDWAIDHGCTFLGMGEYLDFTSHSQRSHMGVLRESTKEILDQMVLEQAQELLSVLAPTKGRWVGMLEGDHRWDFLGGTSVDQYLCSELKCPFLGTSAMIRITAGVKGHPEADAVLFIHHGIGSSRTAGGHLIQVENLMKVFDFDIGLMGHSHGKVATPIDKQVVTPDGIHTHRTVILARTGAWLKGYGSSGPLKLNEPAVSSRGSYVEQKAYQPSALGGIAIGIGYEKIQGSRFFKPALHVSLCEIKSETNRSSWKNIR